MDDDSPAAHSMDTLWYAVDRDGHVACFFSGEAGAVPVEAFGGDDAYQAYQAQKRLAQVLPACEAVHELKGRGLPGAEEGPRDHMFGASGDFSCLMFLASLDPVRAAVESGQAIPVQADEGVAVVWPQLPQAEYDRLHADGVCRGCLYYQYTGGEEGASTDLARHGLFCYTHLAENWISGPYGRERRPSQPVHIDQLPPALRKQIKGVCFDSLRFAETPHIQPVEHGTCASWEAAYLDVTGKKIRPIPGQEEEYAQQYDSLADGDSAYEVEPPPGTE